MAAPSGNQAVTSHSTAPASVAAAKPAGSARPVESAHPGRLNQPPTSALAAAEPKSPAIPTAAPRRAASAAPPVSKANLIVIATGHDTLAALYSQVYRGVTPPAFTTVAALNPQQPRPGDVLTFPPPAGGWHADSSPAATRK